MEEAFNIKIPKRVYKALEELSVKSGTNSRALVRFWMTQALDNPEFIRTIRDKATPWFDEKSDHVFFVRTTWPVASLIKEISKTHKVSMSHVFKVCIQENLKSP